MTVDKGWAEIEAKRDRIDPLITGLPPDQKALVAELWRDMFHSIRDMTSKRETAVKDHFTPKPRMTARDDELVRLKEVEQLRWKDVTKRIRANPDWARGPRGEKITEGALRAAYSRRKKASGK
jgi:hypothetical protein